MSVILLIKIQYKYRPTLVNIGRKFRTISVMVIQFPFIQ